MDNLQQSAQTLVQRLAAGDYSAAREPFDSTMGQALSETKLKETWMVLVGQVGPFQKILTSQSAENQGNTIITVTCAFEKTGIIFRITFNAAGQISGLNIGMGQSLSPFTPANYVDPAAFRETEVTVGSGEWALPATLSLPLGAGPFPAVVLVHGSGPQDRDEAIGPNRPFRDLAGGLASRGVAVLRYEKRTKAHGNQYTPELISHLTVQEEVIDDALAAVRLLRQTPAIDPQRIYVLGHSLGATVAPRIGQQDPGIAGLIIMGGMTRAFEDTILDQYTYLYHLSGTITGEQQAELDELKVKVARVKDPNLSTEVPAKDLPLNISPVYWLDLRDYHPADVAKSLNMRIFVLQGGRDYQVTATGDYPAWQKALENQPNARLKLYPSLFHLFMPGEGPSTPQEYFVENHVSAEVIEDIASWISNP